MIGIKKVVCEMDELLGLMKQSLDNMSHVQSAKRERAAKGKTRERLYWF